MLSKRKADLTVDDLDLMERVIEQVSNLLAAGATAGLGRRSVAPGPDDAWATTRCATAGR